MNTRSLKHCTHAGSKKVSEYDEEIPQTQTADKPMASSGRATQQSRGTRKTNKAKQHALSSPSRWVQSNAQQNIEQPQNPTTEATINNKSTTEPQP